MIRAMPIHSPLEPIFAGHHAIPFAFAEQFLHGPHLPYGIKLVGVMHRIWHRPRFLTPLFYLLGKIGILVPFYSRVATDPILGQMYPPDDMAGAEQRLLGFLTFRMGGPDDYIQLRGHPRLRMRHGPFAIDQAARDRWVELIDAAIAEERGLDPDVAQILRKFLHDTATAMMNR